MWWFLKMYTHVLGRLLSRDVMVHTSNPVPKNPYFKTERPILSN